MLSKHSFLSLLVLVYEFLPLQNCYKLAPDSPHDASQFAPLLISRSFNTSFPKSNHTALLSGQNATNCTSYLVIPSNGLDSNVASTAAKLYEISNGHLSSINNTLMGIVSWAVCVPPSLTDSIRRFPLVRLSLALSAMVYIQAYQHRCLKWSKINQCSLKIIR